MPNKLRYCGGDQYEKLLTYGAADENDPLLADWLKEFETLYPYLQFIATENKILNPFEQSVVEAYWLGNNLLNKIEKNKFYLHLAENLKLKKRLPPQQFERLLTRLNALCIPHHNFHVINLWLMNRDLPPEISISTMDNCRINSGKITKIENDTISIETEQLIYSNKKMALSKPLIKKINYSISNHQFIHSPQINDIISFHWNFACDKITPEQAKHLKYFTQLAINSFNQTNQIIPG